MQTQAAALTIFGNQFLRGRRCEGFWPGGDVFKWYKTVQFQGLSGRLFVAENPVEWMEKLQAQGTRDLRIRCWVGGHPTERVAEAFAGGGAPWMIETIRADGSDLWQARNTVVDPDAPDRRIWEVVYFRVPTFRVMPEWAQTAINPREVSLVRSELKQALADAEAFARQHNVEYFPEVFRRANAALDDDAPASAICPPELIHDDIPPLEARQLVACANNAWVFGGMGSWNDLGNFGADKETYEQVSSRLYRLLNEAVCAAVNSPW